MADLPDPASISAPLLELERKLAAAAGTGAELPPEALEMLAQLRSLNAALAELTRSLADEPPNKSAPSDTHDDTSS